MTLSSSNWIKLCVAAVLQRNMYMFQIPYYSHPSVELFEICQGQIHTSNIPNFNSHLFKASVYYLSLVFFFYCCHSLCHQEHSRRYDILEEGMHCAALQSIFLHDSNAFSLPVMKTILRDALYDALLEFGEGQRRVIIFLLQRDYGISLLKGMGNKKPHTL